MDALPELDEQEWVCLQVLLELDDDVRGRRFVYEPERVAALTGLDELSAVQPALRRLAQLGLCAEQAAPWMPLRYHVFPEAARRALRFRTEPPFVPLPHCRARLSELAAA